MSDAIFTSALKAYARLNSRREQVAHGHALYSVAKLALLLLGRHR